MADWKPSPALLRLQEGERRLVLNLGRRIGFGNMMQLAEALWGDELEAKDLPRGGAHSRGCCVGFLAPCPGCAPGERACDWCCGSGRVTERVAKAIRDAGEDHR